MLKAVIVIASISLIFGSQGCAAELRSFAYKSVVEASPSPLPHLQGVMYTLPRTVIQFRFNLIIEKEMITETEERADKTKTVTDFPSKYFVRIDPEQKDVTSYKLEDNNDLAFLLVPEGSFFTDMKEGKVSFHSDSTRLSHVGVQYEDKAAEILKETFRLMGEVAGLVLGTQKPMSAQGGTKSRAIRRETVDGITFRFVKSVGLDQMMPNQLPGDLLTISYDLNLDEANTSLKTRLDERLQQLGLPALAADQFKALTAKFYVESTSPFGRTSATTITEKVRDTIKIGDKSLGYIPGIVFRAPSPVTMQLVVNERPYAELEATLPEAGHFASVEMSGKIFKNVSPSIDFGNNGAVTQFNFSELSKSTEVLATIDQAQKSAKGLLDQIKSAQDAQKKEKDDARQKKANREYQLADLQAQIDNKTADIKDLEEALKTETDPKEVKRLKGEIRSEQRNLTLLQTKLKLLKEGMEVGKD